ncbi:MAG: hypothetical protein WCA00_20000 [Candidatus Acidiferrales bacterium]
MNLRFYLRLSLLFLLDFQNSEQRRIECVAMPTAQNVSRQRRTRKRSPAIRKSRTNETGALWHLKKAVVLHARADTLREKNGPAAIFFRCS